MSEFKKIEKKWQKRWEESKIFNAKENTKKKFYILEMFAYPSSEGLHMGHALNYTIGDVLARFKIMHGFNVLHPVGYDALGLPAENAAIKAKTPPENYTKASIKNFMKQQKSLGLTYDWSRLINTSDPEYYKWDQWIFLKMFEKGLAYKKKSSVNWCPKCKTVLANEQVHNGKCWRHENTEVEIKQLEQWFFKTTHYTEELLDMIDNLDWPERTKTMQKKWIGKSYGTEIQFEINKEKWPIFTTRPDTIYGVTFMVISAQHPKLNSLVTKEQKPHVEKFLRKLKSVSEKDMEKEGVFIGSYAINPLTKEKVPIYAGNFIIADYGSGMVMAVPTHDKRDFAFAKKYKIPIKQVIQNKESNAYVGEGKLINSDKFNGMESKTAIKEITKHLEKIKLGKKDVQYKLRDWLISRQRYWGTPIPIINCKSCGPVPVKDIPVKLPKNIKFGKGNPLTTNNKWINVKCPKCNSKAKRETDTMDTFVNSSWYFLRYTDPNNKKEIFNKKKVKYWLPIDQYIGGAEHACMHLIYFRFYTKFLRDLGLLDFDEPAKKLFHQGMLHAADGNKMSKSLGNVVNPLEVINKYSADSLRLALMSFASPDKDTNWNEKVLIGSHKFLNNVVDYFKKVKIKKAKPKTEHKINKAIKEVTELIENFKYNIAIIKIRDLFNSLPLETSKKILEDSLKLLHPFCPHITEELWEKLKNKKFISLSNWPEVNETKIDEKLDQIEETLEKTKKDILHIKELAKINKPKIYIYTIPPEKALFEENKAFIKESTGSKSVNVYAVNDKDIHDPQGKAKKAKKGKPAIYLE